MNRRRRIKDRTRLTILSIILLERDLVKAVICFITAVIITFSGLRVSAVVTIRRCPNLTANRGLLMHFKLVRCHPPDQSIK